MPEERTIRILRLLEYVGPESWVRDTLSRNAVKSVHHISHGKCMSEAVLGEVSEIIPQYPLPDGNDKLKLFVSAAWAITEQEVTYLFPTEMAFGTLTVPGVLLESERVMLKRLAEKFDIPLHVIRDGSNG